MKITKSYRVMRFAIGLMHHSKAIDAFAFTNTRVEARQIIKSLKSIPKPKETCFIEQLVYVDGELDYVKVVR